MKNINWKEMSPRLTAAIQIATKAHAGQTDKAGEDYILHPLRVMYGMETEDEMIVAVLHDTVEDTTVLVSDIEEAFGSEIAQAVDAISKRKGESNASYLERVAMNPLALKVKLRDLQDNMSGDRGWAPPASLMLKYRNSVDYLRKFL